MTTEDIILRHGTRGMDKLRAHLPADFCDRAAARLACAGGGTVLILTGFFVNGAAETDGPPGTFVLARTLAALGYTPVVVTDALCRGLFEPFGIAAEYLPHDADLTCARGLLARLAPKALVSIERCGRNEHGFYRSMRGLDIGPYTAPADLLFDAADGIPTVGIGDGGNEIGMGALAPVIRRELDLEPCVVPADELIIAAVSNWGAYALAARLQARAGRGPVMPPADEVTAFFAHIVACGCTDGMSGKAEMKEDGFDLSVGLDIYSQLQKTEV